MTANTWPGGERHAMDQSAHAAWNADNYPGTLQLCSKCEEPTGRCEEDSIYAESGDEAGPLCEQCWELIRPIEGEQACSSES